jgi:hypothetical protein
LSSITTPRVSIDVRRRHAEADAQIGKRNHIATHIDHARHDRACARYLPHGYWIDDFAHQLGLDRKFLFTKPDHRDLKRSVLRGRDVLSVLDTHKAVTIICGTALSTSVGNFDVN